MHGGFKSAIPVTGEPLPLHVRQEIHKVIRDGHSILCVAQGEECCELYYRDGSRLTRVVIQTDEVRAA